MLLVKLLIWTSLGNSVDTSGNALKLMKLSNLEGIRLKRAKLRKFTDFCMVGASLYPQHKTSVKFRDFDRLYLWELGGGWGGTPLFGLNGYVPLNSDGFQCVES